MSAVVDLARKRTFSAARCAELVHYALDRTDPERDAEGGDLVAVVKELDRAMNRLAGIRLALVAQADRASVADESGLTGTDAWLAGTSRVGGAAAATQVGLAKALEEELPLTRVALEEGTLSTEHAQVISKATRDLPEDLTSRERERIEWSLVEKAKRQDPAQLRRSARRALEAARRASAAVDAHEDAQLRADEERALERSRLTFHDNGDGTMTGRFVVPALAGSVLRKVIEQMVSPRRDCGAGVSVAGATGVAGAAGMADAAGVEDVAGAAAGAVVLGGTGLQSGQASAGGRRRSDWTDIDWAHRRGLALTQLLEHLDTSRLHGKAAATIVVTIDESRLREGIGAAHLDTGQDISAGEARRLACNAGILPLVLSGESIPLDYGRTQRFFQESQRVALAARYDSCAADGCDRPYAWSELHHEDPWSRGGDTNLDLAVPLCRFHHRRAHDPAYSCAVRTDRAGIKAVGFRQRGSPGRGGPDLGDDPLSIGPGPGDGPLSNGPDAG